MSKRLGGRPVSVWTPAAIAKIKSDLEQYLYAKDNEGEYVNTVPNISAFAFERHLSRQRLYEFEELRELIELCKTKKESDLEMGMLSGAIPPGPAIFSLKQLGWTDQPAQNDNSAILEALDKVLKGVRGELQS